MGRKEAYEKSKTLLLTDHSICPENRRLWKDFFELQERKLKRINNLARLDEAAYKTLNQYIGRFKNVNSWFQNKPWTALTKADIQKVYDDLEDGVIKNRFGKRYEDRKSYYTKVFKSKPLRWPVNWHWPRMSLNFTGPRIMPMSTSSNARIL